MRKWKVELTITTDLNPNKWNWSELLDLQYEGEELNWVEIEEVKEASV